MTVPATPMLGHALPSGTHDAARNALILSTYRTLGSLAQTAKRFGITSQRVSQIIRRSHPAGAVSFKRGMV